MVKYATLASSFFTRWQIYKRRNEKQSSNKISASVSTYGIDTTAVQHIREIVFSSSFFSGFHIIFRDPTSQSPLFMFRKLYMQSCQPSFRKIAPDIFFRIANIAPSPTWLRRGLVKRGHMQAANLISELTSTVL